MGPKQVQSISVGVDLGVMAMKGYSKLPRYLELKTIIWFKITIAINNDNFCFAWLNRLKGFDFIFIIFQTDLFD